MMFAYSVGSGLPLSQAWPAPTEGGCFEVYVVLRVCIKDCAFVGQMCTAAGFCDENNVVVNKILMYRKLNYPVKYINDIRMWS